MRSADVLRLLAEHRDELERLGVASLTLFGSVARDEAGPRSDVDLLVELERPMGLFGFFAIKDTPRLAVLPEQIAEEAGAASCAPEMSFRS